MTPVKGKTNEGNTGRKSSYVKAIETRLQQYKAKRTGTQSHKLITAKPLPPSDTELVQMNRRDPKKINYLSLFQKLRDPDSQQPRWKQNQNEEENARPRKESEDSANLTQLKNKLPGLLSGSDED